MVFSLWPSTSAAVESAKFAFLIAAVLTVSHWLAAFIMFLDLNKRVYNHVPGECSAVAGNSIQGGAAGVAPVRSLGLLLVTAGLRTGDAARNKSATGSIYAYNASDRSTWEAVLQSTSLTYATLNPRGLDVFEQTTGDTVKVYAYVVNHRRSYDTVEVFRYKDAANRKTAAHLKTIKSPLYTNLRDVAVLGRDRYYATNFQYFRREPYARAERYVGAPLGTVLYFDGRNTTVARRWVLAPSGLAMDTSKKFLYVASLSGEKLLVFKIDKAFGLELFQEIALYTSPDGVSVDRASGDLYVACHPVKSRLFYITDHPAESHMPSQVLRLRGRPSRHGRRRWNVTSVFANDGATLSGAAAAAKLPGGQLLIGSLYDKLLACDYNDRPAVL